MAMTRGVAAALGWVAGTACMLAWPGGMPAPASLAVGVVGLVGVAALVRGAPGPGAALAWALVAAVLAAGLGAWRLEDRRGGTLDPALQGRDLPVTVVVADPPQRAVGGWRLRVDVDDPAATAVPARLLLFWPHGGDAAPAQAGERWRITVRLRAPQGPVNPHGFDRERWLWEQGIGATGTVRALPMPQRQAQTGRHPVAWLRQTLVERIHTAVPDPRAAGVLAALSVGEQSAIARDDWDLFRATGIAHLVSISGLHVTAFAWLAVALVGALGRRAGRRWPGLLRRWPLAPLAAWAGVGLAACYALLAGGGLPAQRTVAMLALSVALRQGARHWPWPVHWTAVLAALTLLDPAALLSPGFWMSFVAVAVLFGSASPDVATGVGPRLRRLLREQAVVTLALAPVSLWLFGQVSLIGLVANLVAIPWVTLVVTPLALLGALVPPLWTAGGWAVQGLVAVLQPLAALPGASLFLAVPPWPLALPALAGGALLVAPLPPRWRLAGPLLMAPALLWQPPRPAPGQFDVLAIDVGQGSAVLVRTARYSLLFDTGPRWNAEADAGERIVVPLLRALGESPAAVMVSHRDSDHAGGAEAVRAAFPAAAWWSSYDAPGDRGAGRCLAGQSWTWDGVRFTVVRPLPADFDSEGRGRLSTNAMSCVLRVDNGSRAALLTGDLDATRERQLVDSGAVGRLDLLLAPHHGSATSSSAESLDAWRPSVVIAQSGFRNPYGHPAAAVVQRWRERGIRWVASPACGAARWRSDAPETVDCARADQPRRWRADPATVTAAEGRSEAPVR